MAAGPTAAALAKAAAAQGITIPAADARSVLAGATWLKQCVALLRKSGLGA